MITIFILFIFLVASALGYLHVAPLVLEVHDGSAIEVVGQQDRLPLPLSIPWGIIKEKAKRGRRVEKGEREKESRREKKSRRENG